MWALNATYEGFFRCAERVEELAHWLANVFYSLHDWDGSRGWGYVARGEMALLATA